MATNLQEGEDDSPLRVPVDEREHPENGPSTYFIVTIE